MTMTHDHSFSPRPLRLWPGVAIAVTMLLLRFVVPLALPEVEIFGVDLGIVGLLGTVVGALAILVWWLFFSRALWFDRLGALVLMAVALAMLPPLAHESMAGAGRGVLLYVMAIPVMTLALVAGAAAGRRLSAGGRRATVAIAILIAGGLFTIVRTGGVTSDIIGSELHWRWTPTAEERLLAQAANDPVAVSAPPPTEAPAAAVPAEPAKERPAPTAAGEPAIAPAVPAAADDEPAAPARVAAAEWPGFRGPARDGVVRGVRIGTEWSAAPPVELWRRPIGPGWSSFAVRGDLLYTQEQRGDDELVSCYRVSTGEPVWQHRDAVRFWESNGGAGPRATPTIHGNLVYAFGATGILNALDARRGTVVWTRDVANDSGRKVPEWGFASSPLVVDDIVVIAAAGTLVAYDLQTGERRWSGPSYGGSYSSPHRATIDGVPQILLLGGPGAISVAPADGAVLWQHAWSPGPIVQPALTEDGDVLVNAITGTGGIGTRRLDVARAGGEWTVQEQWTSNGLKPYFNDFVVHEGHAFGFDGSILACIDLADGNRKWKGGRYGNGQLVLLPDQDVLLVLSEDGELALVSAAPDGFREIARFQALEAKTWNHPVLIGDLLLVRNGEEMAAFQLPPATR